MRRTPSTIAAAVVAAAALAAAPAADLPSNGGTSSVAPTTVDGVAVAADGLDLTVTADVDLGGQAPVELGSDPAGDAAVTPETAALGLDLTGIHAWVEDGDEPLLTFAWRSTARPAPAARARAFLLGVRRERLVQRLLGAGQDLRRGLGGQPR
jgi:hypothetical protein